MTSGVVAKPRLSPRRGRSGHVADGNISSASSILRAPSSYGALQAGRAARHYSELPAAQGQVQRDRNVCASTACKADALGGSFACAATQAIYPGKLHSTGAGRRQRNRRRACREVLASDFGLLAVHGPVEFVACNPPKTAKLVIGFVAEQVGEATLLTTETQVYCPDRYSLIMFTTYWLIIRPVSGLLRQRALAAIREIAEHRGGGHDALRAV